MSDEEENEKSEDEGSPLMIEDVIIKKEVVVIGAGISGLSAAKLLHKHEVDVLVLEARDRVGGRTLTKRDSNVKYVDLGGSYVGPTQNRLLRLAKELEVENYVVNEVEKLLYYYKGKRRWYSNDSLPFSRSPLVILDLYYLIYLIDKHGSEIPVDAPWDAPHAKEWDNMTMKEWIDKHLWTTEMKDVMHLIVVLVVTQESSEVSALWFLWYIRQCDNFLRVISTTNGGQERKFIGGSQTISERMAEILKGSVILDKPVTRIMQNPQVVTAFTQDGNEYLADYIILATAPSLHMKIHWDPPLPPLKNQLAQRVPVGSVMKAILYYKTPFWRKKGFCGSAFLIDDNIPVILSLDDTKPEGTHAAIIGFVCGDKLRSILHLTKEARRDLVIEGYVKGFDCAEFRNCIHYEEKNWMEEQYSGGCYTGTYPPGVLTQFGRILREPFDRVYFAGTETGTHWSGYMEGAVESGERAAREVLYAMGKIRKDQIWQEEPESRDVPEKPFPLAFGQKIAPRPGCVSKMLKFLTFGTLAALGIYYLQKKEIITVRIN